MKTPENKSVGSDTSAATAAKDTAADLAHQVRDTAAGALESTTKAAATQANTAKATVADEVSDVASALRTAAEQMRSGSPQERTFGQIAGGLADASEALRDKDLGTIVQDINRFARNNPVAFLGGAALVGFAATRFLKASGESEASSTDPYSGTTSKQGGWS